MRWGHRKAIDPSVASARQAMITAKANKKAAAKSYNKAYRNANSVTQNLQFDKASNKSRNNAMMKAANKSAAADKNYNKAKAAYKQQKNPKKVLPQKTVYTGKQKALLALGTVGGYAVSSLAMNTLGVYGNVPRIAGAAGGAVLGYELTKESFNKKKKKLANG